jgi:hypothetical protein
VFHLGFSPVVLNDEQRTKNKEQRTTNGGKAAKRRTMNIHYSTRAAMIGVVFLVLISVSGVGAQTAREPFFSPTPPMEAFDFPKAAEEVKLRGMVISEDSYRAVVYVQPLQGYRVLRPLDQFEVIVDGLRHEFRVEGMGGRRLVLRGQDGYLYEIGVEQRD